MHTNGTKLRTIGRILGLACILGLVANVGAAAWHIVSPESAPKVIAAPIGHDEPAYMTGALGSWRGSLPLACPVEVVDSIAVDGVAAPLDGVWAGQYDPTDGSIQVIRSAGDLTLAHEYGHALLLDLIVTHEGTGSHALSVFDDLAHTGRGDDRASVPEWLRGVFDEYRRLPADPYGDAYYGASFNEYFAESFAWTANRDGIDVAPVVLAFLTDLDRTER